MIEYDKDKYDLEYWMGDIDGPSGPYLRDKVTREAHYIGLQIGTIDRYPIRNNINSDYLELCN